MYKRFSLFLLFLVAFLFTNIDVKAQLNETFNNITSGIPSGWDNSDYDALNIEPWQYYASGFDGSAVACQIVDISTPVYAVLKTPTLSLSIDCQLSFYYKSTKSDVGKMSVYLISDGKETLLFDNLTSTSWSFKEYDLSEYSGKNVQIYFKLESFVKSTSASSLFILDNVKVANKPLCAKPENIVITTLATNKATISWSLGKVGDKSESFFLTVKNVADGSVTSEKIDAPDLIYTIKKLKPNTEYEVTLSADCSGTGHGESEIAKITFTTLCASQSMPYAINFNGISSIPECWFASESGVSIQGSVKYGKEGSAVKMTSSSQNPAYLVSRKLALAANMMQISMNVYAQKGTKFSILLTPDPLDLSQAVMLWDNQEILQNNEWYNLTYNTRLFDFSDLGWALVIFLPAGSDATLYIDDVNFSVAPTCAKLNNLREIVSDSTFTQIDWTEFTPAESYEVVVFDEDTSMTHIVTEHPCILSGLAKNSKYSVKARAICSANDTSEWSNTISVHTTCGLRDEPIFKEDFESGIFPPECWFRRQTLKVDAMVYNSGDATWRLGSEELYGKIYNGRYCANWEAEAVGNKAILVTQPFYVDVPHHYDLSMWVYRHEIGGKTPIDGEGINIWVNNRPDTIGGTKLGFVSSTFTKFPVEESAGFYKYDYNIPLSGKVYIIFEGVSRNCYDMYIDDIEVKLAPFCRKVSEITLSDITTNSVKLSWKKGLNETKWNVTYQLVSGQNEISNTVVVEGSPELVLNNLIAGSQYSLRATITADCGAGDVAESATFTQKFETDCDAINAFPYIQTFDDNKFPPHCWSQYQSQAYGNQNDPFASDYKDQAWVRNDDVFWDPELIKAGAASAKLQASSAGIKSALVSPLFYFENGKEYVVSFWMYRMPEPKDFDNASAVDNEGINILLNGQPIVDGATKLGYINVGSQFVPQVETEGYYKYEFEISATGNKYIIFEGVHQGSQMSMYIDNVVIREKTSCGDFDVKIDSIKTNIARVTSRDLSVSDWQVSVGEPGFNPNTGKIFNAKGESVIISGLESQTDYELYARRKCDDGTYGPWSEFVLSFATQCAPIVVGFDSPYFDGFENFTVDENILGCYQQVVYGHGASMYYASSGAYTDDGTLTITSYEGELFANLPFDNDTWLFRPFELKADKNYEVSVMGRQDCDYGMTLNLAYCTEPNLATVVDTMASDLLMRDWKEYKGWINVPADGIYYIGVNISTWGFSVEQNNSAIDNFSVKEIACAPPVQIKESKITAKSADIDFHSIADVWEIKVSSVDFDPEYGVADIITDTIREEHYTINGLDINKEYFYSLRSLCSDPSEWSNVHSFRTICSAFDLPYSENFEDPELNNLVCWNSYLTNPYSSKSEPTITKAYLGTVSYKMFESITILPEFDVVSLSNYLVRGYVLSSKDEANISIGVISDITNPIETFEAIANVVVRKKDEWQEFVAYLSDLAKPEYAEFANARYIAFVVTNGTEFYFDNLEVIEIPTCLSPTELSISNVTSNSCQIDWYDNSIASKWQVQGFYKNELQIDTVVSSNPAIIRNLNSASNYDFRIRTICSEVDSSWWSKAGDITTDCDVFALPYDQTFTGMEAPKCWHQGLAYPNVAANYWIHSNGAYYYNQPYIFETETYPEGYTSMIVSPEIDLSGVDKALLSFDLYNNQTDSVRILLSEDRGNNFDIVLGEGYRTLNDTTTLKFDLSKYVGKVVSVAIEAKSSGVKGTYLLLDNFSVEKISDCVRPVEAKLVFAYDVKAKFLLTDTTANKKWQYVVGSTGFNPDGATAVDFSTTNFEITGLTPQTNYEVYVRSICGSVYSDWRGPVTLQTACAMDVDFPYVESFEGITSLDNNCFKIFTFKPADVRLPFAELNSQSFVTDGAQAVKFSSSMEYCLYMSLPLLNTPLRDLKISFDYSTEYDEGYPTVATPLELGVMSDLNVEQSYTKLALLPYSDASTGDNETFFFNFADVDSKIDLTDKYIVIKYHKTPPRTDGFNAVIWAGVDNIEIVPTDFCYAIDDLKVIERAETDFTVAWVCDNSAKLNYEYQLISLDGNILKEGVVSTEMLTVTDLDPATIYKLKIRCLCSDDNYSDWKEISIRTTALSPTLPYQFGFEDAETDNWILCTEGQTNYFIVGEDKLAVKNGNKALYITNDGALHNYNIAATSSSYAYRIVEFEPGQYTISYSWKCNGEYTDVRTADYGRVYLAPISQNIVAGKRISAYSEPTSNCIMLDGAKGLNVSSRWNDVSVDLVFTEKVKYNLVVEWYNNASGGAQTPFAIDDIFIQKVNCPMPESIDLLSIDDRSVEVKVNTIVDADNYLYRLSLADTPNNYIATDTVNSKTFVIDGLSETTKYLLSVAMLCDDNEISDYQSIEFVTENLAAAIPYSTDFASSDENSKWVTLNGKQKNQFVITDHLFISADGVNYGYDSQIASTVFAYRLLDLPKGQFVISYDWKSEGSKVDFARIFLVPAGYKLKDGESVGYLNQITNDAILPNECIPLDGAQILANKLGTTNFETSFFVAEPGRYKLVVQWHNKGEYTGTTPIWIDNLTIEKASCANIDNLVVRDVDHKSVIATFANYNDSPSVCAISTTPNVDKAFACDTVLSDTISFSGLQGDTKYYLFVKAQCLENISSEWEMIDFTTNCNPVVITDTNPYFEGFETYADNANLDNCWSSIYKFEGKEFLVTSDLNMSYNAYPVEGAKYLTLNRGNNKVTISRNFYLEQGVFYSISAWAITSAHDDDERSRSSISLVDITNNETLVQQEVGYDSYKEIRRIFVPKRTGIYNLGFVYDVGLSIEYANIDNFSISVLKFSAPDQLSVDSITTTKAQVSWLGVADEYDVQLYKGSELVVDTTTGDMNISFSSLSPATTYTVKVRSVIKATSEESDWVATAFTTDCDVALPTFVQDFESISESIPVCWDNMAESSLADYDKGWKVKSDNGNRALSVNTSEIYGTAVVVSPMIYVDGKNILSYRYQNLTTTDKLKVEIRGAGSHQFNDVILDGGHSGWQQKLLELSSYQGDTIQLVFTVSANANKSGDIIAIDDVRIACYAGETVDYASICQGADFFGYGFSIPKDQLFIGVNKFDKFVISNNCDTLKHLEVTVNSTASSITYDTICKGDIYTWNDVPYIETGRYQVTFKGGSSCGCDSIAYLYLEVLDFKTNIDAMICEGESYKFGGREITETGIYVDTIPNPGSCDSIKILNLVVIPSMFESSMTICEDEPLVWNDTTLKTSGRYTRTYQNINGCDSIEIINLTVIPKHINLEATICQGSTYLFRDKELSESGVYVDSMVNVLGCDSIITLNLTVKEPARGLFDDYVCEGYEYIGFGFSLPKGEIKSDTILSRTIKTIEGCDSLLEVNVRFIPTIVVDTLVIIPEGDYYEFGENTYTKPGKYTETFVTFEGCDSIVNLTLEYATAVDNIYALPLIIAPNPITGSQTAFINHQFTAQEQQGLRVEILNSVGQVIVSRHPDAYPIAIKDLQVAGLYYIRITTGTGNLYLAKLVVR